jgi:hypothetical protein
VQGYASREYSCGKCGLADFAHFLSDAKQLCFYISGHELFHLYADPEVVGKFNAG